MQTSDKDKILGFLINRRDFWQAKADAAKINDFFNVSNYQNMASELNYLITMIRGLV